MDSKTTIMIIDDSYTNRILLKTVLEDLDIEVTEAFCADKALKLLETFKPDLILLDMCMPMMNGLDFLKQLNILGSKIPVIIVSVLDDEIQKATALQTGAKEYLIKPVKTDELIKCIARYTQCEVII